MTAKKRHNWLRRTLAIVAIVVSVVGGWYLTSRIASPWNAVKVECGVISAPRGQTPDTLRIAAYNIAHGRGAVLGASNWTSESAKQRRARLEAIGAFLADQRVDIAVLNEVDFSAAWSGHVDQASVIAEAGGFHHIARQRNCDLSLPFARFVFGNAVLSRHPITQARLRRLPSYSMIEALFAGNHDSSAVSVALPDGTTIAVWPIHLEVRSEATRIAAIESILGHVDESDTPVFLVGDFNSTPASFPRAEPADGVTAIDVLLASGRFESPSATWPPEALLSFPSESPVRAIDWCLPPAGWRVLECEVPRLEHSDHLPVIATVAVPANEDD